MFKNLRTINPKIVTTTDIWKAPHYAILTFYLYCQFNIVLTLCLIIDLYHNINILCSLQYVNFDHLHVTTAELRLSEIIGAASYPDTQKSG